MPLMWKVWGSLFMHGPGEHAAITEFNEALAKGNVKILPAWFGHIVVYLSVVYLYVA